MKKDKITFRVEESEMRELAAEGGKRGLSPDAVAREWMREYAKLKDTLEAMSHELTKLREENARANARMKIDLGTVCMVLLTRAGKEPEDRAQMWVREKFLKN